MTGQSHHTDAQQYLPGMGKHWLLPLYDPFSRLAGIGRIHGQLMDRANLRSDQRILEIGCGTGNLLTALGRRLRDIDALGIDPDPAALRRARRKAARYGLPIRYEQAFAGALPLPDDSVDRVLSAFMLHHLDDDERARALRRPGGCCAAAVSCTCSTSTAPPPGGAARRRTATPGWPPAFPSGCWPRSPTPA
ncbi:class I SAM-dependent methyltransferase [Verrucosispora sioxanthis]|uniref:class I SAM-dependent methyltransferase n=1 Tax=Verrucosispora sioxanthis TaxID=2499994 RepID=UPI002E2D6A89|nr:class I SAM-dependent methyltransferase [Verrucosispora sioxanthis]